jgi:hypothetical protein
MILGPTLLRGQTENPTGPDSSDDEANSPEESQSLQIISEQIIRLAVADASFEAEGAWP